MKLILYMRKRWFRLQKIFNSTKMDAWNKTQINQYHKRKLNTKIFMKADILRRCKNVFLIDFVKAFQCNKFIPFTMTQTRSYQRITIYINHKTVYRFECWFLPATKKQNTINYRSKFQLQIHNELTHQLR